MADARGELVRAWLERARPTLDEAEGLARQGHWNGSVNRIYYACFDAVRALLLHRGYRFSKHSSVQSLWNQHFGKTGIAPPELRALYNILFEARGAADYEPYVRFDEARVRPWLDDARRFIALIETLIRPTEEGRPSS